MNISKKLSINNNNIGLRSRVGVDLMGNITSQSLLIYLNKEEKDSRKTKEAITKCNIHLELKTPLILAQINSLLPVYGVSDPDFRKLKFKWRSLKILYSLIVMIIIVIYCALAINRYIRERGVSYRSLADIMFYGTSLLTTIFFLKLAKNWKDIISKWVILQNEMNNLESLRAQREIKLITICLLSSSIFEHLLSNTQSMLIADKDADLVQLFLYNGNVFEITGYHTWFAIVVYVISFIVTIIWNYPDIFLTSISLSLANMFKQFNKELKLASPNMSSELSLIYWKKKRETYNNLALLTKMVESEVSHLVLLSFANNIYFICIQLLNSIQPLRSLLQVAYFCGSFGHILLRTCSVCYAASSIYDNSKEPLSVLFSVPSEQYNYEVQRMITQINTETLALTGCKFFTVTRTLMLTIAGTIVTYEIVLVQFNGLSPDDSQSIAPTALGPSFNYTSS